MKDRFLIIDIDSGNDTMNSMLKFITHYVSVLSLLLFSAVNVIVVILFWAVVLTVSDDTALDPSPFILWGVGIAMSPIVLMSTVMMHQQLDRLRYDGKWILLLVNLLCFANHLAVMVLLIFQSSNSRPL